MTVSQEIVARHFGRKVVRTLAKRGVVVIGPTFVPGPSGGYLDGVTVYNIDDNGTHRVRTYLEVLAFAKSQEAVL